MGVAKDITGQKFNRLTAVELAYSKNGHTYWKFLCDCGSYCTVRANKALSGHTKSCGCLQRELAVKRATKHGMCGTKLYTLWWNVKKRTDPHTTNPAYRSYVENGIDMYEPWLNSFEMFCKDVGTPPSDEYTLGRIDNFKGYYPDNVRWETYHNQSRNKSKRKSNKTGVTGVFLRTNDDKYDMYSATAVVNGQKIEKAFSINRFGEEVAFFLACEQREQWLLINEMCFNDKYAETHGISKEEYDKK